MKNTLAENMLRFGVKNLSESDVKKIEESLLTEAPAGPVQPLAEINPNSWKFKDQSAWDKYSSNLGIYSRTGYIDPKAAGEGLYGPWAWELIPSSGGRHQLNPNARERLRWIAMSVAVLMAAKGYNNYKASTNPNLKVFATVLKEARIVSARLGNIGMSAIAPNIMLGGEQGQKMGITDQTNAGGERMTQSQWEATFALIAPTIDAVIAAYVVPKAPAAAAPGMTPGAKPVPGKQ